jgi:hypothetical protein
LAFSSLKPQKKKKRLGSCSLSFLFSFDVLF